jgi:hypothetical protein
LLFEPGPSGALRQAGTPRSLREFPLLCSFIDAWRRALQGRGSGRRGCRAIVAEPTAVVGTTRTRPFVLRRSERLWRFRGRSSWKRLRPVDEIVRMIPWADIRSAAVPAPMLPAAFVTPRPDLPPYVWRSHPGRPRRIETARGCESRTPHDPRLMVATGDKPVLATKSHLAGALCLHSPRRLAAPRCEVQASALGCGDMRLLQSREPIAEARTANM